MKNRFLNEIFLLQSISFYTKNKKVFQRERIRLRRERGREREIKSFISENGGKSRGREKGGREREREPFVY